MFGYASAAVPPGSVLTNKLVANAYDVGSTTPLVPANTPSASVLVVDGAAPSGRIVSPLISALSQGAGTCKENVILGASGFSTTVELASAALWCADAGHQVAHTTVHVHGGVGIDLDGEAHRYFTAAKRWELTHGGAGHHARRIGRTLADA